jgi:hypothetical protein
VSNKLIRGSSVSFRCFSDSFTYEGGDLPVRHIESAQLLEISPTAAPAYGPDATDVAIRSLASQFGEDPDSVYELARAGELRKLFTRTDLALAPATMESRSDMGTEPAQGMSTAEARTQLERMRAPEGMNPKIAALQLWQERWSWDRPATNAEFYAELAATDPREC